MTYLAITTIDLKNAESEDYECVNKKLAEIGLKDTLKADNGNDVELPHNTYAGKFTASKEGTLRDNLFDKIKKALKSCKVKGKVFVAVHGYWIQETV